MKFARTNTNLLVISGLLLSATLGLGGCQGYSSYPTVDGASMANKSPDAWPQYQLAGMAARYVADRYPPSAPSWASGEPSQAPEQFVVNIPSGMSRMPYERAISFAGPGAQAPGPDNASLPTYHITRIWSRGHRGVVDVMRPVAEVGEAPGGKPVYQTVTVYFEGGFQPWRISGRQVRDALTADVPQLVFMPAAVAPGAEPAADPAQPPVQANTPAEGQAGFAVLRPKRKPISLAAGDSAAGSVFQVNDAFSSGQPRMATVPPSHE
jgi:hypothetical protein